MEISFKTGHSETEKMKALSSVCSVREQLLPMEIDVSFFWSAIVTLLTPLRELFPMDSSWRKLFPVRSMTVRLPSLQQLLPTERRVMYASMDLKSAQEHNSASFSRQGMRGFDCSPPTSTENEEEKRNWSW